MSSIRLLCTIIVFSSAIIVLSSFYFCEWRYPCILLNEYKANTTKTAQVIRDKRNSTPVILVWTGFFDDYSFMMPDLKELKCPVSDCLLTRDRKASAFASVILYHWRDVNVNEIPESKPQGQKWALLNYESPLNVPTHVLNKLNKYVDWTLTYRLDSDIVVPYGKVRPRRDYDTPAAGLNETEFQNKLPVTWMASNCKSRSRREELAKEINKHLRVDVFGKCSFHYGRRRNDLVLPGDRLLAYRLLAKRYKLYLSFENSVCKDYVTEKAFHPLEAGMIPVVLGGAEYDKVLPPGSFIDARTFASPRLLTEHMIQVTTNFTLYSQYLDWRRDFVVDPVLLSNCFVCDICARAHYKNVSEVSPEGKRTLSDWWDAERDCQ